MSGAGIRRATAASALVLTLAFVPGTSQAAPRYPTAWHFLSGTYAQRRVVASTIARLNFPQKYALGRYIAISFGPVSALAGEPARGYATPRSGYFWIKLGTTYPFTTAHEIGHAVEYNLLSEASIAYFGRLVAARAPPSDCLSSRYPRTRLNLYRAYRDHSCIMDEEFASAFANAYGFHSPAREGHRLTIAAFRAFFLRSAHLRISDVTDPEPVACYFAYSEETRYISRGDCIEQEGVVSGSSPSPSP